MTDLSRRSPRRWRRPEELVEAGFDRSRVVMMNEAHSALRRSIRTREIGRQVIPIAHEAGVRHLAMEALNPEVAEVANRTRVMPERASGYLAQPEMRRLIRAALDRGWSLIAYEADFAERPADLKPLSSEGINWREEQQARRLADAVASLPCDSRVLVWCGNGHLSKADGWIVPALSATGAEVGRPDVKLPSSHRLSPMGCRFGRTAGFEAFAIDQTVTVEFDPATKRPWDEWGRQLAPALESLGGTAGFLVEEAPPGWPDRGGVDAVLLSTDNALT